MIKLMTLMLAVVPFGMLAQSSQNNYTNNDDIFNLPYADAENVLTDEKHESKVGSALKNDDKGIFIVNDMLLADPDFEVQENMITFTKDQKTVFFSANRKLKTSKEGSDDMKVKKSVQLNLFKADVQENGEWVNLKMLPFNGKNYSTGHPALNVDDTKLYFVSDGPESMGKTDIFVVDLLKEDNYGQPENLGSKINSDEREVFPMIDDSSVLYFASDKATEGDELNIFASRLIEGEPSHPVKLDVKATGSKEEYAAAFQAIDIDISTAVSLDPEVNSEEKEAEAKKLAEQEADLKDLKILQESERLAEKANSEVSAVEAYDFSKDEVIYTVQIGAFLQNVKNNAYQEVEGSFNHLYDDGFNRFYSGVFESYEKAHAHMEKMKKEGHKDAFVLGLKGQERFFSK